EKIDTPLIREIRGRGLFIGVEHTESARPYCEELKELGILCTETHDTVIRLAPPLLISTEELAWSVDKIDKVLSKSVKRLRNMDINVSQPFFDDSSILNIGLPHVFSQVHSH